MAGRPKLDPETYVKMRFVGTPRPSERYNNGYWEADTTQPKTCVKNIPLAMAEIILTKRGSQFKVISGAEHLREDLRHHQEQEDEMVSVGHGKKSVRDMVFVSPLGKEITIPKGSKLNI